MKKYDDFIVEKLNIELFNDNFNPVAEKLDSFWNKLKNKLTKKVNVDTPNAVAAYNQKIRNERKKSEIKPLEDVKKKEEKKPLTDRELNFKKDTTKELFYKIKLDKYKDYHNEIEQLIKQRQRDKQDKKIKYQKEILRNKQEKETQKNKVSAK